MSANTGLLLVAHGTRSEVGTAQFLALAETIRQRAGDELHVEAAFLELQQPDIDAAIGRLVEQRIAQLVTMPLLLFAAGHAKEDVPGAVTAALARRGRSNIGQVQARHLGCHRAMVELSRLRADEALSTTQQGGASGYCSPRGDPGTENVCLLLVGRGSHDASATAEMHEFAGLREKGMRTSGSPASDPFTCASGLYEGVRQEPLNADKVEVAFLAMARPLLAEQLTAVARQDYRRVIVQPHLLFCGELVDSMEQQVAGAKLQFPETEWITTRALADLPGAVSRATDLMEKVILDRCQEAGIHVVVAGADD